MASPPSDFTGKTAIVTGSSGFVGHRLCEMLAERGATKVIGLDIVNPPTPTTHNAIEYRKCDITSRDAVVQAMEPVDCVWHIAALVGPFYPKLAYDKVNYQGTLHILTACRHHNIKTLVYSSSPSTRFDGSDVRGAKESELQIREPGEFLEAYAETKAQGELAVLDANNRDDMRTVAIAPHQVYGPYDPIFLPNLMEASRTGKLRVFGNGTNCISMVHVDNYCHGLILGYHALQRNETSLKVGGEFIVVTDGGKVNFWDALDSASIYLGFGSIRARKSLPRWLLMSVAIVLQFIGRILGRSFKLTPFTVKMLTIDRWFNIEKARDVLGYKPVISYEDGWKSTLEWFKENPEFLNRSAKKSSSKLSVRFSKKE